MSFALRSKLQMATAQAMHDMQTPLLTLRMSLKALKSQDEKIDYVQIAEGAIDDVHTISQALMRECYDDNTAVSTLPPVQLQPLIRSIVETQRLIHRHVKLVFQCTDVRTKVVVNVERSLFKRLLTNLINNAIEAIAHDKGEVTLTLSTAQNQVTLALTDNGCGMSNATLQQVLETGESIGKDQSDITKGQGLGLSSAGKWMVEWGGELEVRSTEGHGTTITLRLPSAD